MSDSLLEGLAGQFSGNTINQLAGLIGADQQQTAGAVAAALPMLLGSMAGSTQQDQGANALFGALSNDHDGSIFDSLGALLGGGYASRIVGADGARILGHVFGGRQNAVESTVAQSSGLSGALVSKLLPILAPMVMGYLGKRLSGDGLDAGGLGAALGGERDRVRQQDSGLGGLLDALAGGDNNDDSGGGLMDMAGDFLSGPAGKAILGQILKG